jgi:hypothetical protein
VSLGNRICAGQPAWPGGANTHRERKRIRRTAPNMQVVPSGPSQDTAGDVLDADTIIKRGSDLRRLEGSHASDQRERHSLETRRSSSRKYVFPGRAAVRDTRSPDICGTRVRQAGASGRWGRSLLPRRRRVQPGRLAHPDRCGILTRPIPGRTPAAKLLSLRLVTGMRLPRLTLSRRDRLLTPCG